MNTRGLGFGRTISAAGEGLGVGNTYSHPALKQLKEQQARFAPGAAARTDRPGRGAAGGDRPVAVLPVRIPLFPDHGVPPRGSPALVLDGKDVRHDLRLFVEDLSGTVGQAAEQAAEPVLTVDAVSRRFNVSTRTVARWRGQGLVARRFVIGGRTKVGFLESSLARFVAAHRDQVDRGTRFRQLTDAERDEIIRRARRMAADGRGGLVEIARRIARKTRTLHRDRPHDPESLRPRPPRPGRSSPPRAARSTTRPRRRSTSSSAGGSRSRSWPASSTGPAPASTGSSTRCAPAGSWRSSSNSCPTRRSTTRRPRRDPRPDARAGRRPRPRADQGPQRPAAVSGQPVRGSAARPGAGGAPLPQDELPEVRRHRLRERARPGQRPDRRPRRDRAAPGRRPGRQEPDHPRQPPPGRLDRQAARRARATTSSNWSPTATCP